jgi:hypothetical protein
MVASDLPGEGEIVDIKSTKGSRVYENCEVIGLGSSGRGTALWVWTSGAEKGVFGRVHAFIPVDEIDSWQVR